MGKPLKPGEILEAAPNIGFAKTNTRPINQVISGILAETFIAFAVQGSSMAAFNSLAKPETFGLGEPVSGLVLTPGLISVLIAGAELLIGNVLMFAVLFDKKITWASLIRTLVLVYIGNSIGSLLTAWMVSQSGQWEVAANTLGARIILIANDKVGLTFGRVLILGILYNWLICLGVWMSSGADSQVGRMLSAFLLIMPSVTSNFEHNIANMYYIPAGIMVKVNLDSLAATDLGADEFTNLIWSGFSTSNLIPVTLGNIVSGVVSAALAYRIVYRKKSA